VILAATATVATGAAAGTKSGMKSGIRPVLTLPRGRVGEEFPVACPGRGGDIRLRENGRQEPAHFEPEVRKRKKARMASPA